VSAPDLGENFAGWLDFTIARCKKGIVEGRFFSQVSTALSEPRPSGSGGNGAPCHPMVSIVTCIPKICAIPADRPAFAHRSAGRRRARILDDILGYHYYTELAHSAGMDQSPLAANVSAHANGDRAILGFLDRIDNNRSIRLVPGRFAAPSLAFEGERVNGPATAMPCAAPPSGS